MILTDYNLKTAAKMQSKLLEVQVIMYNFCYQFINKARALHCTVGIRNRRNKR